MIGIAEVASYIPESRRDNYERLALHGMDADFIERKIGITSVARKKADETTSDLCVRAWNALEAGGRVRLEDVDCVCVCTQTPDHVIPHVSAILHGKLGLRKDCAVFDISHGCAGYVYSLHALKGFMQESRFRVGLLFTCDPYSEIVSGEDRNTDLLFGDAATVTLLSCEAAYDIGKAVYHTDGKRFDALIKRKDAPLFMDGRGIFNFVMKAVPGCIEDCLAKNGLEKENVDVFLMHQASRFLVSSLIRQLAIPNHRVPYEIKEYGNTVSSSIPLLLEKVMASGCVETLILSGFGVGLCVGSTVLRRR